MKIPKDGSVWMANNGERFRVINSIFLEEDSHYWIHYMKTGDNRETYSCYVESFLSRFTEVQDDSTTRVR